MDVAEVEENLFTATDAKLHGQMCKTLSIIYCKVLSVFPSLEAARPRSKSGIQALCSLHVALEKVKNVLQHCSECSKLYLAITADSVLLKFEKAKSALEDSLRRVEEIVPQSIGCQVQEIVNEFVTIEFALDPSEKQVGNDLIALLQQGRKFNDSSDSNELECFHQAATRLGITSSRAALAERRALKKLLERARSEEDKRKESIIAYLLHLMRKYSKLFRKSESTNSKSVDSVNSCKLKGVDVVSLEESGIPEESVQKGTESVSAQEEDTEQYFNFLKVLTEGNNWRRQCEVVEQLRLLLRDDEEARIFMGANGFVEALLQFLQSAVHEGSVMAVESGTMALFNLAVDNNRNKEIMLSAGVLSLLEEMISKTSSYGCTTALYLNLSCLEEAKPMIGMSQAIQFLIQLLQSDSDIQCKQDALHALYNLSTVPSNIQYLLSSGIISGLQFLEGDDDCMWTERCIAVLINLATSQVGREEIVSTPGLVSALASILDTGELLEQEQAVTCLLILCNRSEECCDMVLQEGVIPALVSISVNGTPRGREKAQKLLMLFREQRRDHSPVKTHQCPPETSDLSMPPAEMKPLCKSISRRKSGRAFSFFWKSKSYSVYQC